MAFGNGVNVDFSGNTMPSAPEHVGNVALGYAPDRLDGLSVEAELVYLASYWLNDANTVKYDGHNLVNLRVNYETRSDWQFFVRATNLLDTRWANSAQVSSGLPQYAPGMPFSLYGGVSRRF